MSDSVDPWRVYRRRRNLLLFAFFASMPVVFVIAVVTVRLFHTTIPAFVAGFSWMAFYAVAGIRFQTFRCPRCGKLFFIRLWPPPSPFVQRCAHCGLPKYAPASGRHVDMEQLPNNGGDNFLT